MAIVQRYVDTKVEAHAPNDKKDLFLDPYYGRAVETLLESIRPDSSQGEPPEVPIYEATREAGTTTEVDFWTGKPVREVIRSHLNYVVCDTQKWEQSAAYYIDQNAGTRAFVKNDHLGFAIPYLHDAQMHEYLPDFLIRLNVDGEHYLILETKGFDPQEEYKVQAAQRWVEAVNTDGQFGRWQYAITHRPAEVRGIVDKAINACRVADRQ